MKKNQCSQYSQWSTCRPAHNGAKITVNECGTIRGMQNRTSEVKSMQAQVSSAEGRVSRVEGTSRPPLAPRASAHF